MPFNDIERQQKLLQLIQEAIRQDNELRLTLHIGEKFRFIHDRLSALLSSVEKNVLTTAAVNKHNERQIEQLAENEMVIYVYLFNAHGLSITSWQKMLKPELLYEYSVNRPIYLEKTHVEAFIRSKTNKAQHGYMTIIVPKEAVFQGINVVTDVLGSPVVKVKEGVLSFDHIISFTHAGKEYLVNANSELTKKE